MRKEGEVVERIIRRETSLADEERAGRGESRTMRIRQIDRAVPTVDTEPGSLTG
jgi:hypothetical protein